MGKRLGATIAAILLAILLAVGLISISTTQSADAVVTSRWVPKVGSQWQWQINQSRINPILPVAIYDIDYQHPNVKAVVAAMHAKGIHVICYVPTGDAESYRDDWGQFQGHLLGNIDGWPGERWINVNDPAVRPILKARFQSCKDNGFDAVEPDEIEAAFNGQPVTPAQQLVFNKWVADTVHSMKMSVLQKGDDEQTDEMHTWFDGYLQEEAFEGGFRSSFDPYVKAWKWVGAAEYTTLKPEWCTYAKSHRIALIQKRLDLGAFRKVCP